MKNRLVKKRESLNRGRDAFFGWLGDLRCYLLEAMLEEENTVELIARQFKHKYTHGKRTGRRHFQATRMRTYMQWTMGDAYGKECRR